MVQFLLLPSPPGNPGDKVGPSGPGVGNFSSGLVPGVGGGGKYRYPLARRRTGRHSGSNCVEYFAGESFEFVG